MIINLINFKGRIARKNYFWGLLLYPIILFFVWLIPFLIILPFLGKIETSTLALNIISSISMTLLVVVSLFSPVVIFSLHVRRLHDIGYSGWFVLLSFVPIVGILLLLYLLFIKGNDDTNEYGGPVVELKFFDAIFSKNTTDTTIT